MEPLKVWPRRPEVFFSHSVLRQYPGATDIRLVAGEFRFWGPKGLHVGETPLCVTELLQAAS